MSAALFAMAESGTLPSSAKAKRISRVQASRFRYAGLRPTLTPGHGNFQAHRPIST